MRPMNRRNALVAVSSAAAMVIAPGLGHPAFAGALPLVRISRDESCGCCKLWADHLATSGFPVEIIDRTDLRTLKAKLGVPSDLVSCHTAEVAGYVVEGHVPASAIKKLLDTKQVATGLSVPRMPIGSPGMESGDPASWRAYEVIMFGPSGRQVYARYRGLEVV